MTFASEACRTLFHRLPTDRQVEYSRLEESLSMDGKALHVESVMANENRLEVVVRISEKLNKSSL